MILLFVVWMVLGVIFVMCLVSISCMLIFLSNLVVVDEMCFGSVGRICGFDLISMMLMLCCGLSLCNL